MQVFFLSLRLKTGLTLQVWPIIDKLQSISLQLFINQPRAMQIGYASLILMITGVAGTIGKIPAVCLYTHMSIIP